MNEERLHELIRLLKDEGLTEITVTDGDQRFTVKQAPAGGGPVVMPAAAPATDAAKPDEAVDDGTFTLSAPIVGTFYERPNPDEEPFVKPGDIVEAGAVVGIIEAMKVMNEIHVEAAGRVRRVLVENGSAVEYGQGLILFERL